MAPRAWFSMDGSYPVMPKVQALLVEFGAVGPYTMVVLLCTAQAQHFTALTDAREPGRVQVAWPFLAVQVGDTADTVRRVVERMEALGHLELEHSDDVGMVAHFAAWDVWDQGPKDPKGAARQAKRRARIAAERDKGVTKA